MPVQPKVTMSTKSKLCQFVIAGALTGVLLTGCYVMPVQPDGRPYPNASVPGAYPSAAVVVPAPGPVVATVRLYPSNDVAANLGVVNGQVMNLLDGRGQFNVNIGSEVFTGEATRLPSSRSGTASASGNRGGFLSCNYTMTNATLGSGTCSLSTGAQFRMHLGG
jgi:hypothetical protein